VPGGGISLDGTRWVSCKPGFFLPVRVLSRLYRRLFLEMLIAAHKADRLQFFNGHAALADFKTFAGWMSGLRQIEWVTYAKRPFGGPEPVLAYLSRYTHRIAISNRRLVAWDDTGVTFKCKDYRLEGPDRYKMMTLSVGEFIRRFLMHVLPKRFHRIRHYGLFANGARADNIARARELLKMAAADSQPASTNTDDLLHSHRCPCCGGRMIIIETFERGSTPRYRPATSVLAIGFDTS
jgi:Putative transposase